MRRIRGTVSHFSLYFQLVGLAAEIRTVHETEDYGGVICTPEALPDVRVLPILPDERGGAEKRPAIQRLARPDGITLAEQRLDSLKRRPLLSSMTPAPRRSAQV